MLELLIVTTLMGGYMMKVRNEVLHELAISGKSMDESWL